MVAELNILTITGHSQNPVILQVSVFSYFRDFSGRGSSDAYSTLGSFQEDCDLDSGDYNANRRIEESPTAVRRVKLGGLRKIASSTMGSIVAGLYKTFSELLLL